MMRGGLVFDEGENFMKKLFCISLILCILVLSITSCAAPEDEIVASLGEYEEREFFTCEGFQDHTDYAKYHFRSAHVAENSYLSKIQEADLADIDTHLDDFEKWIEAIRNSDPSSEVVLNYDFDRSIVDTEDHFYIDSEMHTWSDGYTSLVRYDIYFFDSQTQVLYYFHNNM